jgi:hypothetical protein
MPLLTSLKCPVCSEITQTAKVIRPGDKIPCEHCGADIPVGRPRRDPVEEAPVTGAMEPDVLRKLLAEEEDSPGTVTTKKAKPAYRSVTNEPLPPPSGNDQPFVRNPLAPAGARSKDRLIGGKGVRFTGSREFMAVVIIVAVAGVAYLSFWGLHGVVKETEKAGDRFAKEKEKAFNPGAGPLAKKSSKGKTATPPPNPEETRVEAGHPMRIGVTEVTIVNATRAGLGALQGPSGLTITLQITNYDAKPITYYRREVILRDRTATRETHPLLNPLPDNPMLTGRKTETDVLEFGPTPMFSVLELDLPASGSDEKFQFFIPTQFIQTTP